MFAGAVEVKHNGLTLLPQFPSTIGRDPVPLLERSLRRGIFEGSIERALAKGIEIVHGLQVEQLDGPLEHADIGGDDDFVEREKVLDEGFLFIDDDSAALRTEGGQDAVFGQVDGQLYELLVELPNGLAAVLHERVLKPDGDIGIV